jgi:hypothetical protein
MIWVNSSGPNKSAIFSTSATDITKRGMSESFQLEKTVI